MKKRLCASPSRPRKRNDIDKIIILIHNKLYIKWLYHKMHLYPPLDFFIFPILFFHFFGLY